MPRGPRLDYCGALHHVIGRGLEKRFIFQEQEEKQFFYERSSVLINDLGFTCYAWAIMGNHYHLLLETGPVGLSQLMSRLLTAYAHFYNRRHQRVGYVFQNRFKSILCEKDTYLLSLIRYIHLNPVKAGVVDLLSLHRYPWTGHREVLRGKGMVDGGAVLDFFGEASKAKYNYKNYINAGIGKKIDLEGGGLVRSNGGVDAMLTEMSLGKREQFDSRILGTGLFVEEAYRRARIVRAHEEEDGERYDIAELLYKVACWYGVEEGDLLSRTRKLADARKVLVYLSIRYGKNITGVAIGKQLGITGAAVSQMKKAGEGICDRSLIERILQI